LFARQTFPKSYTRQLAAITVPPTLLLPRAVGNFGGKGDKLARSWGHVTVNGARLPQSVRLSVWTEKEIASELKRAGSTSPQGYLALIAPAFHDQFSAIITGVSYSADRRLCGVVAGTMPVCSADVNGCQGTVFFMRKSSKHNRRVQSIRASVSVLQDCTVFIP
jgi:hypothetical protein